MAAGADFSSASSEFKALGAFFCNSCHFQLCHPSALRAHGERTPVFHILWPRSFRDHTIFGRGFNIINTLWRHFRATRSCRQVLLALRSRQTERPRLKKIDDQPRRSPPGVRAVEGGHGVGSGDPRYVAGQSEERTTPALFQKEISLRIFARLPRGRMRERATPTQGLLLKALCRRRN